MAENKMKEVAKLLGIELNEPFNIEGDTFNPQIIKEIGLCNKYDSFCEIKLSKLIIGSLEIEKPVLNDKEKRYLEGVIEPFKNKVEYISKIADFNNEWLYVAIHDDHARLPCFEKGKMYIGMELNEKYTLKELGLFNDD